MSNVNERVRFLKNVNIFSLLSEDVIENLLRYIRVRDVKANTVLFREGDPGNELYIVESGVIGITLLLPDGKQQEIYETHAGEFFGEMAIFENAPRSATCRAKRSTRLLTLSEEDFFNIIDEKPEIAISIMFRMLNITTQRLRSTGGFLTEMVAWGEKARKRTITDELTGVYNRRYLEDNIVTQFERARMENQPLSILMVDLDFFRDINETFGHEIGDRVIIEAVSVYKKYLRDGDVIARYGGDEFTVVLPDTPTNEAFRMAETIRQEISLLNVVPKDRDHTVRITTSQGLATFPEHGDDLKALRQKADQALYKAKMGGRNCVVRAE